MQIAISIFPVSAFSLFQQSERIIIPFSRIETELSNLELCYFPNIIYIMPYLFRGGKGANWA